MSHIVTLEKALCMIAERRITALQAGVVPETYANVGDLVRDFDYKPAIPVDEGVRRFVERFRTYFNN